MTATHLLPCCMPPDHPFTCLPPSFQPVALPPPIRAGPFPQSLMVGFTAQAQPPLPPSTGFPKLGFGWLEGDEALRAARDVGVREAEVWWSQQWQY